MKSILSWGYFAMLQFKRTAILINEKKIIKPIDEKKKNYTKLFNIWLRDNFSDNS